MYLTTKKTIKQQQKNLPSIFKNTYNSEKHFNLINQLIKLSFINENILIHKNCTDQELIKISLFRVN
jgi:hypothetical protein